MKAKNTLLCGLLFTASALSAQLLETSFYTVRPANGNVPVIDGKIFEDPAWTKVERHTTYYEYIKPNPGPSKTKTEFRMLYDTAGLYLAVINYGDTSKLRANITRHDDGSLWTDDCAELYFDNYCDGLQFRKFMVNSKGVVADLFRLDPQNTDEFWSANGWRNASLVVPDAKDPVNGYWTIESFFPWDDLGGAPVPHEVRAFVHCRFAMGIGILSTSSPGGGYYNSDRFGRIYFAPDADPVDGRKTAEILNTKTRPPWCVQIGDTLWKNEKGAIESENLPAMIANLEKTRAETRTKLADAMKEVTSKERIRQYEKLMKESPDAEAKGLNRVIRLTEHNAKLYNFFHELICDRDFK